MNKKIQDSDISVVIQGAISPEVTAKCLRKIRHVFPGAQMILSTWNGTDVNGLEFDRVVLSEDPGGHMIDPEYGTYNNVNRQIIGTFAGLKLADRQYTLKTRTDIIIENTRFINYFKSYAKQKSDDSIFENRIVIGNYYTRDPRVFPLPYHPSDWVMFGRTSDIMDYYDISPMHQNEYHWFSANIKETDVFSNYLSRFTPEQYMCISFLKKHREIVCENYYDIDNNLISTEKFFACNFIVLDYGRQLKIKFLKYHPNRYKEKYSLIGYRKWKKMFKYYCLGDARYEKIFGNIQQKPLLRHRLRKLAIQILDAIHLKEPLKKILKRN